MPTNKPKVQAVVTQKYFDKLQNIAIIEGRSISQMTAKIIENYIDKYEEEKQENK